MSKKRSSPVWEFFEVIEVAINGKEVLKSSCKLYGLKLAYSGGTSNLIHHLEYKHIDAHRQKFGESSDTSLDSKKQTSITSFQKKPCSTDRAKEITGLISEFIALDLRPVSVVDGKGFVKLVNYLEPSYKIPSRTHVTTVLKKKYNLLKKELRASLSSKNVAFTTDIWTSQVTEAYITLTVHYINNEWNLVSSVLTTEEMPERHTGVNITQRIQEATKEWEIHDNLVSCIVHDNASNMTLASTDLGWDHLPCFAHTLQLAVTKGLECNEIARLSAASRKLIGHFKRSVVAMTALRQKQEQLNVPSHQLIQDVSTRWNSTMFMFERLVERRCAIYSVLFDEQSSQYQYKHLNLKENQWELMAQMAAVLEPLQIATTALCESQIVSCSLIYPVINGLINNHLVEKDNDLSVVKKFKKVVQAELKRRFDPSVDIESVPVYAAFLDPHYHELKFLIPNLETFGFRSNQR